MPYVIIIMKNKKLTLKQAQKEGRLEEFIKEHENDEPADKKKLEKLISSVSSGKSKSTQETSEKD